MNKEDFTNNKGQWVQRTMIDGKYTWTTSGVLWNNVKERCTEGSATQAGSPNYRGAINDFDGFQKFAEWNRKQVGYGLGYDLDADMLKNGTKRYSEKTCLLVPSALNRFIQSYGKSITGLPQGVVHSKSGFKAACELQDENGKTQVILYKHFKSNELELATIAYVEAKNKCADIWRERLESDRYTVDQRVKDYMKNWVFKHKEV